MKILKYKITIISSLIFILIIIFYRSIEGFENHDNDDVNIDYINSVKSMPPSYLNDSIKTSFNNIFGFYGGKGTYKIHKTKEYGSSNKITKLNELLKNLSNKMDESRQDCLGKFNKYSGCNKTCGTDAYQVRKYKVIKEKGKYGKECDYEHGYEEKIPCLIDKCENDSGCMNDMDCKSNICDKTSMTCKSDVNCSKDALYACSIEECSSLDEEYNNASQVIAGNYLYNPEDERCFFREKPRVEKIDIYENDAYSTYMSNFTDSKEGKNLDDYTATTTTTT
jgi:hypothetical protein